jgi:hypothetical protein
MMTNHPPILRYSVLALPLAVGPAFAVSVEHGLGATASATLLLGNFWLWSTLAPRVVSALAASHTEGGGDPLLVLWVASLGAKLILLVGAFVFLIDLFPPASIAVGFLPNIIGTLGAAVHLARLAELEPGPIDSNVDGKTGGEARASSVSAPPVEA